MNEILSQAEIDALLKNLNSGEADLDNLLQEEQLKKISKYDFRRPSKFAKEHIRTLQIIHENYSKFVSNILTRYLRTSFQIEVVSIEPLTYLDFDKAVPNPSILALIDLSPLKGSIVLNMPPSIVYSIIDRLLGGASGSSEVVKNFTAIELSTINGVIQQFVKQLKEPWKNVIGLSPKLERIETNPELAQVTSPNEMIILVTFKTTVGGVDDIITLCYPHIVIESIMPRLNAKLWFSSAESKQFAVETRKQVEMKASRTKVTMEASLGTAKVTFNEVINLQIGDIIALNTNINDRLPIYVNNYLKFEGSPGSNNKKFSLKITDIAQESAN